MELPFKVFFLKPQGTLGTGESYSTAPLKGDMGEFYHLDEKNAQKASSRPGEVKMGKVAHLFLTLAFLTEHTS
jgi:hypothetical protein